MKKFFITAILFLLLSTINIVNAQVGVGVSTANVNPSAQLEVLSTTKGFLPPRMTTSQRDAINAGNPAEGLVIFNTTNNAIQYKSDTGWVSVLPSSGTSTTGTSNAESVTIGNQIWTTKNLSVDRYRNGDIIPQVTSGEWGGLTTGAWCWYRNDSATYAVTYGRMYNWYAINDPRGLAPVGWHIPTNEEWTTLGTSLGNAAGGSMKSPTGWPAPNTGATNSSGFGGLPGGGRVVNFLGIAGNFEQFGTNGYWWTSTAYNEDNRNAYFRSLTFSSAGLSSATQSVQKHSGLSVRCVKD